jgi:hypothetical protein
MIGVLYNYNASGGIIMLFDPLVLIPSFNNPTYVRGMMDQLQERNGQHIRIIDNASSTSAMHECLHYLKLLDGVEIERRSLNAGPRFFLDPDFYATLPELFVITDPDLSINPLLPETFLEDLLELTEHHKIGKTGFALEIKDHVDMRQERFIINDKEYTIWEWEHQF